MLTIGPFSRPNPLARLDGRSRPEQFRRRIVNDLTAQLGGSPTVMQRLMIERAALLSLKIALLEKRVVADTLTDDEGRYFLSWCNAFTLTLRRLGLKPPKRVSPVEALREALRGKRDEAPAASSPAPVPPSVPKLHVYLAERGKAS